MDCQGLVVRLIQDFVLLTTAVEVAQRWRELAEKLAKVSKQQMDAYESPHRDRNGVVDSEVSLGCGIQSRLCLLSSVSTGVRLRKCASSTWWAPPGGARLLLLKATGWESGPAADKAAGHEVSAEPPTPDCPVLK